MEKLAATPDDEMIVELVIPAVPDARTTCEAAG